MSTLDNCEARIIQDLIDTKNKIEEIEKKEDEITERGIMSETDQEDMEDAAREYQKLKTAQKRLEEEWKAIGQERLSPWQRIKYE
jgi:uncharacterized protein YhaN